MEKTSALVFFVNGKKVSIDNPDPRVTLIQYLRRTLYLTGTKEACSQGACGACTVMVSYYNQHQKKIIHYSCNACMTLLCTLHGTAITTVEGVGSTRNGLHTIQNNLLKYHGLQCGFCTPGMVMTMYTMYRNNKMPEEDDFERALEGNLCRCTGYRSILEAFKSSCGRGKSCCMNTEKEEGIDINMADTNLRNINKDESQEVIFPNELQKESCSDIRNNKTSRVLVSCTGVSELKVMKQDENEIVFGSAVTFSEMEQFVLSLTSKDNEGTLVGALLEGIRWIAADQVRNVATIGGHVMSTGPHDLQTLLMTSGAILTFQSAGDKNPQVIKYSEDFFPNSFSSNSILISVRLPRNQKNEFIFFGKQPFRRGMDYAVVNAGLFVKIEEQSSRIKDMRFCVGNIESKPRYLENVTKKAVGSPFTEELLEDTGDVIVQELKNSRAKQLKYKITLACAFFFKFYKRLCELLQISEGGTFGLTPVHSTGAQFYDVPADDSSNIVWQPVPHVSSESITTGEAVYVDDIPEYKNELSLALVSSSRDHAKILSVDFSAALGSPGVEDFVDYRDVPGELEYGEFGPEAPLFADKEVTYFGQPIAGILARTREEARAAAKLVKVEYENLPAVFTIDDATEKENLFDFTNSTKQGNIEQGMTESEVTLEGVVETGAQEHLYMEPCSALICPKKEDKEIEIFVGTQDPSGLQKWVGQFLLIPCNRINIRVKRIGGAFGGKAIDIIPLTGITSVAAWKVNRPVRCIFQRDYDVRATGKRHGTKAFYKVGFSKDGTLNALSLEFYLNAGAIKGLSPMVLNQMMAGMASIYKIPHYSSTGHLCQTNIPSSTAMRGFGMPQAHFIIQSIMFDVSKHLNMPFNKLREMNTFREGDTDMYGKVLSDFNLVRCWEDCKTQSNFNTVEREVADFNRDNQWRKRGVAMSPCIFFFGYPPLSANYAGALVNVYKDGSVLISHGGIEMGQGLHTKMCQIAATALGIPLHQVHLCETSTHSVPHSMESGGSFVADLNGGAVKNACEKIKERLQVLKETMPNASWVELIKAALFSRINLSATGFYKSRDKGYDFRKQEEGGEYCMYHGYGAACTLTEIDVLTGEHQILKTDIVFDVGKSLNPAIDVGQIEGGFVQGCGMMTSEQVTVNPEAGLIEACGPINYKIPGIRNIPKDFKVTLLKEAAGGNKEVYSSKGIGEPPLLLAVSLHLALREAVLAARAANGLSGNYRLECPATPERIRMACAGPIVHKCHDVKEERKVIQV
ncbi:xanthine dehydrogenase/oxidase-like [Saccostrea cucullata]|uniref:xanthine dehydrogenase/oxidase-like n=1 Tax=Saccostrea cuccullata TaxID=36930 RepID=UPI002ED338C0